MNIEKIYYPIFSAFSKLGAGMFAGAIVAMYFNIALENFVGAKRSNLWFTYVPLILGVIFLIIGEYGLYKFKNN